MDNKKAGRGPKDPGQGAIDPETALKHSQQALRLKELRKKRQMRRLLGEWLADEALEKLQQRVPRNR